MRKACEFVFDTPPLAETLTAVASATTLVAAAAVSPRVRAQLLAGWGAVSVVLLVGLGHVSPAVLLAVAAIATCQACSGLASRLALAAIGLAAVVVALTTNAGLLLQSSAIVAAACAGALFRRATKRFAQPVTLVLVAGTAIGIYINVPDTEQIAVHAAGLAVIAVAMFVFAADATPSRVEPVLLLAALLMAAGADGSRGRPAAFVGVIGALGVLVAEPLAALLRRGTSAHPVALIAVHAAAVLVASRVAGVHGNGNEVLIVAATFVAAVGLLTLLPRRSATGSSRGTS